MLMVPDDNWSPFELFKVNFLTFKTPEPEITWEVEPLNVMFKPDEEGVKVALLIKFPVTLKSEL